MTEHKVISHPIFIFSRKIPEGLTKVLKSKGVIIVVPETEDCSDMSLNDSKFMGSIAWHVSTGIPVAVPFGDKWMTKKGACRVASSIEYRLGCSREWIAYYLVKLDGDKDGTSLVKWMAKFGTIIDEKQLLGELLREPLIGRNPLYEKEVLTTVGWMTEFIDDDKSMVGHCTGLYGISRIETLEWIAKNQEPVGQTYKGLIIGLTLVTEDKNGDLVKKDGGRIVGIPDLGDTLHVTVKTEVKSSLSGPILQKFYDGVHEFKLLDVDPESKANPIVLVESVGETIVRIDGFYYYVVDPPRVVKEKMSTYEMPTY